MDPGFGFLFLFFLSFCFVILSISVLSSRASSSWSQDGCWISRHYMQMLQLQAETAFFSCVTIVEKRGTLFQKSPHTSSMIYKTEFHHIFITWPGSWNHHDRIRLIMILLKHRTLWWKVDLKSNHVSRNLLIRKKRMDTFKTTNSVWYIS